uniref:Small ribosomal subunit protein uS11c n=1 Tax=Codium arabicum TaxID=221038 RepID=A0A386B0K2_CODAR|nr:ribosomal protein S11 [Codium arabicum]AYC65228.1 ribosomal protein S11 [Codium arabicum]
MVKKVKKSQKSQKIQKFKKNKTFKKGLLYIHSTFNNTLLTLTNSKYEVIFWISAGSCGFKGARKGTPFAAKVTIEKLIKYCQDQGIRKLKIIFKGTGPGRESLIRSLQKSHFEINLICDRTPIPHNGCRPPKKRRV